MKIAVSFDTLQKRIHWKNYVSMILEEIINNKVDVFDIRIKELPVGYDFHLDIDFSLKSQKRDIDIAYIGNTWWFDGSINGSLNKTKYYIDLINKGFGNKY